MLFGVIGLGMSLWQCYKARQIALNIVQGRRPLGPPEPPMMNEYGYIDHEAQRKRESELGAQVMTRDELDSYDIMKTVSFLTFLLSAANFGLGKLGMRTVWREKSQCANRISKKSCIGLVFILIIGVMMRHEGGELHKIISRNREKVWSQKDFEKIINRTDSMNLTEPLGRQLLFGRDGDDKSMNEFEMNAWLNDAEETCSGY